MMRPWLPSPEETAALQQAVEAARQVQTFLWGEANGAWGLEEWLRMFRKRVAKLEEVRRDNPHAAVELRKRLLQAAALSVALIGIIDRDGVPWDAAPGAPPTNLPDHATPVTPRKPRRPKKLTEEEWKRVFDLRCESKRTGKLHSREDSRLIDRAFETDQDRYKEMEADVFDATVPFGSTAKYPRRGAEDENRPIRHQFQPRPDNGPLCCCGKLKDVHGEPCPSCDGSGVSDKRDKTNSPCPDCEGLGVRADALYVGERIVWSKPQSR